VVFCVLLFALVLFEDEGLVANESCRLQAKTRGNAPQDAALKLHNLTIQASLSPMPPQMLSLKQMSLSIYPHEEGFFYGRTKYRQY
jgi:hypothetical protein